MLPDISEFIWAFLPLFYIVLVFWACVKKLLGFFGSEPIADYFTQCLFCIFLYVLSVMLTRSTFFKVFSELPGVNIFPIGFLKFIMYPLFLAAAAHYLDFRLKVATEKVAIK